MHLPRNRWELKKKGNKLYVAWGLGGASLDFQIG